MPESREKKYILTVRTFKPWADPEDFLTLINTFNRTNKDTIQVEVETQQGEEFRVRNLAILLAVMTSTFLIAENIDPETYTQLLRKTYTLLKLAETWE